MAFALDPAGGICGNYTGDEVLQQLSAELANSTYYQRRQGSDHLLVYTHWGVRHTTFTLDEYMLQGRDKTIHEEFRHLARNFVIGHVLRSGGLCWHNHLEWAPDTAKVITV
eukprot:scaffold556210_cov36-Prasinocladus_malaysianus.AAC.1